MSASNRVHYSQETKRKARQLYYDPLSSSFHSYRAVAKELGIPRFQTVAEWAKQQGWNPGKAPAAFAKHRDSAEMLKQHLQQWDQIGEHALTFLLTSEDHRMLATALSAFKVSLKQQRDLSRRLADLTKLPRTPDKPERGRVFPFDVSRN